MWFLFTILCILFWDAAKYFYKTENDYWSLFKNFNEERRGEK
jgi:hypothetical protein